LQAAQLKEASDCAGANAATSAAIADGSGGNGSTPSSAGSSGRTPSADSGGGGNPCSSSLQAVTAGQATVATARQTVAADQPQLAGARTTLANAQQALAAARSAGSPYSGSASYTMLPGAGDVVRRGRPLYAINGSATLLLYGATPAWRAFAAGMSPGGDVAELNANLRALAYGASGGDTFTSATELATRINGMTLQFERIVGEDEKLFGSVSNRDIADQLKRAGIEIDHRTIALDQTVKALGKYEVPVKLAAGVVATLKFWVVGKDK